MGSRTRQGVLGKDRAILFRDFAAMLPTCFPIETSGKQSVQATMSHQAAFRTRHSPQEIANGPG